MVMRSMYAWKPAARAGEPQDLGRPGREVEHAFHVDRMASVTKAGPVPPTWLPSKASDSRRQGAVPVVERVVPKVEVGDQHARSRHVGDDQDGRRVEEGSLPHVRPVEEGPDREVPQWPSMRRPICSDHPQVRAEIVLVDAIARAGHVSALKGEIPCHGGIEQEK